VDDHFRGGLGYNGSIVGRTLNPGPGGSGGGAPLWYLDPGVVEVFCPPALMEGRFKLPGGLGSGGTHKNNQLKVLLKDRDGTRNKKDQHTAQAQG